MQSLICVGWLRHSLFMFGFHVNDARSLLYYLANGRALFDFCLIVTFQRRVLVVFYSTVEGAQTFLTSG